MGQDQSYINMYQDAANKATSTQDFFTLLAGNFATYAGMTADGYYREEPVFTEPKYEPSREIWHKKAFLPAMHYVYLYMRDVKPNGVISSDLVINYHENGITQYNREYFNGKTTTISDSNRIVEVESSRGLISNRYSYVDIGIGYLVALRPNLSDETWTILKGIVNSIFNKYG